MDSMANRLRARAKTIVTQRSIVPAGTHPSTTLRLYDETCEDVIDSPGQEHYLKIEKIEKFYDPIGGNSKASPTDTTYSIYDGKWMYEYQQTSGANHLSLTGTDIPSDNEAAINMLSRTNPSKPDMDFPVFLAELRDIPHMLKSLTQFYRVLMTPHQGGPKDLLWISDILLNYHFGWKPLVSDLQKMLNFVNLVDKKIALMRKLQQKGGYHASAAKGNYSAHSQGSYTLNSEGGVIIPGTVDKLTTCRVWASTRWYPKTSVPWPATGSDAERKLAIRAVFGLDISPATVWEAMPWSWLIDWCSNVGEYLNTYRNTIPCEHSPVCVMRHTKTTEFGQKSGSAGQFMTGGKSFTTVRTTKTRVVMPFVLPETSMPFLDARQVSILGSLAVQRIPRDVTSAVGKIIGSM